MLAKGQLRDADRVDLRALCSAETENYSEHMHIRFDRDSGRLAVFRAVGEPGEGEWLRADLDASVRLSGDAETPDGFFLTAGEADNVLTFLDRLRVEQSPAHVGLLWYDTNNSPMVDASDLDQETLILSYKTDSGRENKVQIDGVYQNRQQMMARY